MPTPNELFLADPFVQELKIISKTVNQLMEVYLNKDVQVVLPFTNSVSLPAFSSSAPGVDALQASLNQGAIELQARVAALVVPTLNIKVVVEPGPGEILP